MSWHRQHYDRYKRGQRQFYERLKPQLPPDALKDLEELLACMRLVAMAAMCDAQYFEEKAQDFEVKCYFLEQQLSSIDSAVLDFRGELDELPEAER